MSPVNLYLQLSMFRDLVGFMLTDVLLLLLFVFFRFLLNVLFTEAWLTGD